MGQPAGFAAIGGHEPEVALGEVLLLEHLGDDVDDLRAVGRQLRIVHALEPEKILQLNGAGRGGEGGGQGHQQDKETEWSDHRGMFGRELEERPAP
jgi:hypothetical protein